MHELPEESFQEIIITHPDCQPRFDDQGRVYIDSCVVLQITGTDIYEASAFLAREQLVSLLHV